MALTPATGPAPLHLLFNLGADRYALPASVVRKIMPLQRLKHVPEAPAWVAGLLSYHGEIIPVLDLCERVFGQPARHSINTRLVLLHYSSTQSLGLILEKANQVVRLPSPAQQPMGLDAGGAYLGSVQTQGLGDMVQHISIEGLLPPDMVQLLFPPQGKLA